jgi:hypothetical protein
LCRKKRCVERGFHIDEYVPGQIDFVKKAYAESLEGATVVCLLPSRTDTTIYHTYINPLLDPDSERFCPRDVRFVEGRLTFHGASAPAPFPSVIVVFRPPAIVRGEWCDVCDARQMVLPNGEHVCGVAA